MPGVTWPALGTLVFFLVVVAPLIAAIPLALSGGRVGEPLFDGEASRWLGALFVLAGLPMWVAAAVRFVRQGHGTPAPIAPPERLVVKGLYRRIRNPMYVAVLAVVVGMGLLLGSGGTLLYAVLLGLAFHTFVVLYEEPTLRSQFGEEYDEYCRTVPRWIPRWSRPRR